MKNIKKTKILVPALALTMLTTVASVTSTVAWYVSNSQATATGLSMAATSNSANLIISEENNSFKDDQSKIAYKISEDEKKLLPVAIDQESYAKAATNTTDYKTNFYTMVGTSTTDGTGKAVTDGNGKKYFGAEATDFNKYVVKRSAYLKLVNNSVDQEFPLTIDATNFSSSFHTDSDTDNPATVLVVPSTQSKEGINGDVQVSNPFLMKTTDQGTKFKLTNRFPDKYVLKVDFYFYHDGNNKNITSSIYGQYNGNTWTASVDFQFDLVDNESANWGAQPKA